MCVSLERPSQPEKRAFQEQTNLKNDYASFLA
jgi:hypothetical protein